MMLAAACVLCTCSWCRFAIRTIIWSVQSAGCVDYAAVSKCSPEQLRNSSCRCQKDLWRPQTVSWHQPTKCFKIPFRDTTRAQGYADDSRDQYESTDNLRRILSALRCHTCRLPRTHIHSTQSIVLHEASAGLRLPPYIRVLYRLLAIG